MSRDWLRRLDLPLALYRDLEDAAAEMVDELLATIASRRIRSWDRRHHKPCARCELSLPKMNYSAEEWARTGDAGRRCLACQERWGL